MSARRVIATVLVVGVGIGAGTTLLDRGETQRALAAPVAGISRTAQQRIPIKPVGPVTIATRADDPRGATPWAVRRVMTRSQKTTYPCLQLGRLDGPRFGWIAPGQPFRLARLDLADVPNICGATFPRGLPQLSTVTLTTDASAGLPEPDRTIVWGVLPPGFTSARLNDGTELRAGAHGVVLVVLPGRPVQSTRYAGTLRAASGATRRFAYPAQFRRPEVPPGPRGDAVRRRLRAAGTAVTAGLRIAARMPDPAGGAAWGILTAPSTTGRVCFSAPGHLVGDRLAVVEPRLGIARPDPFNQGLDCSGRHTPTRAHPLRMDVLGSSIPDEDPTGTEQLRRLNDRMVLFGRTTADVREVTITTSRDIRTVSPDPRSHVVMAVYDGRFPGESFRVTATLRDGSRRTVIQTSGG